MISQEHLEQKNKVIRHVELICASKTWLRHSVAFSRFSNVVTDRIFWHLMTCKGEFWILKTPKKFNALFTPQTSLCNVIWYLKNIQNKKLKPHDTYNWFAPPKRDSVAFFQHFQKWWWVEYSAIFESHETFFSHQADFPRNEVMTKPSRIWGGPK